MATVNFPSTLRPHLISGFSRTMAQQFAVSYNAAGSPIFEQVTTDHAASWNVQFIFNQAQAATFNTWFENDLQGGTLPFNMDILIEAGSVSQEVWFAEDGMPQLTKQEAGLYYYSARLISEQVNDPDDGAYELLLWFAEDNANNDPEASMSLLDIIVNEQMTAASEV